MKSQYEENDLKALGLMIKELREQRSEKFINGWLQPLQIMYEVVTDNNGKYTITTQDYGIIDYFPKANKILIREENRWIKPGLRWIINNLFVDTNSIDSFDSSFHLNNVLNNVLNKVLITERNTDLIDNPNSNKIAEYVSRYINS